MHSCADLLNKKLNDFKSGKHFETSKYILVLVRFCLACSAIRFENLPGKHVSVVASHSSLGRHGGHSPTTGSLGISTT